MRKRFVVNSYDLQAVLNESLDRKSLPVGNFPEMINLEDMPVPTFCTDKYIPVNEIPECCEDVEEDLLATIDENIAHEKELQNGVNEILDFAGQEPRLRVPGRVVKTVKRVLHPERKSSPVAACFCAVTGLLIYIY